MIIFVQIFTNSRISRSIKSKKSKKSRSTNKSYSLVSKVSKSQKKKNYSSKSFSKSPNFQSLKTNFNFKTQTCKTSSKIKKEFAKFPKNKPKNEYSSNLKSSYPMFKNPSQTTFDSQKVFSTYTTDMKIYFSPNRVNGAFGNFNDLDSSFLNEKMGDSVQKNDFRGSKSKTKLEVSEQIDDSLLNNFKSLRQFEIPKPAFDYTSYNSYQDVNVNFFEKTPQVHKNDKIAKNAQKHSFFQGKKKGRGFSRQRNLKTNSFFRKLKFTDNHSTNSFKSKLNLSQSKSKYRKSSLVQKVMI